MGRLIHSDRLTASAMDWNIKNELAKLRSRELQGQELLEIARDSNSQISEVQGWHRAGAETYTYVFTVTGQGRSAKLIAKALVALTPAIPPERQLELWVGRRMHLAASGVAAPTLVGTGSGILVEEFLEFDLSEMWSLIPNARAEYIHLVSTVIDLGYAPRDFVRNMRCDGHKFAWIDFGEDLGGLTNLGLAAKRALLGRAEAEFSALALQTQTPFSEDTHEVK